MTAILNEAVDIGVYCLDPTGEANLVHSCQSGEYRLDEIFEFFQLGRLEESRQADEVVLVLTMDEIRMLKTMADAYSFDYDEEFIEMCLQIYRHSVAHSQDELRFIVNF